MTSDPPSLSIRLLGPPIVQVDGAPLHVDTRKATAILAYLTVARRPIARDRLGALLWPEAGDHAARGALRRTLSSLRTGLRDRWLRTDRSSVSLDPDGVRADVWRIAELLAERDADEHAYAASCVACTARLEEAAELLRGPFMSGFSLRDAPELDDWIVAEAETWRDRTASVLDALTAAQTSIGRSNAAILTARRRLALDPLDETAHRRLMRLLADAGDSAGALRQYRECVRVLDDELGVAPLPETQALQREIAERRQAAPAPRPAPPASPRPAVDPRRLPLVGRAEELGALRGAWAGTQVGGRVIVLEGEPGIGKSRLANDLAAEVLSTGGRVVSMRCYAPDRHAPFAALSELLRGLLGQDSDALASAPGWAQRETSRLLPELDSAAVRSGRTPVAESPDALGRRRFVQGLVAALASALDRPDPVLVVLDDAQWTDDETRQVLERAAARIGDVRCLLLVCRRSGDDGWLTAAERLRLDRLNADSVARLANAAGADLAGAGRLFVESEGLPFFVVEYLAQALSGDRPAAAEATNGHEDGTLGYSVDLDRLPASVRAMLESRLTVVSEAARQVMTAAAVIGRSFDPELVRIVSGRSPEETVEALDELQRHGLIRERLEDATYDFDHERTRELAYRRAGLARRRLLHRRVAEALTRSRGRPKQAAVIALHLRAAGDDESAAMHWESAGEEAMRLFAYAEAIDAFRAALGLAPIAAYRLHERIGDAETIRGRYADAETAYEAAAAAIPAREVPSLARIEHKLGALHLRRGDHQIADVHLAAALDLLPNGETSLRSRATADRALAFHRLARSDDAALAAADALRLASADGDREARAQAHNLLGMLARADGDLVTAAEHLRESLTLAAGTTRTGARIAALNNLALVERALGNHAEAVRLTRTALRLCITRGDRHREAALRNNLADLLNLLGRRDEARAEVVRSVAIFAEIGDPAGLALEPAIWKLVDW